MSRKRIGCLFRTDRREAKQETQRKPQKESLNYKGLRGVYLKSISKNSTVRLS